MIARVLMLVIVASGVALAQPATKRKAAPDKYAKAASEAFTEALAADQKNDLTTALGLYQKAFELSPHPSTIYNIADVQRRNNKLPEAIKAYYLYLALSPTAPDAKEVEALIEKLGKTTGVLVVTTSAPKDKKSIDLAGAYIIIDGEIKKKPGVAVGANENGFPTFELDLPPGRHVVDIVTPLTYAWRWCEVKPGQRETCWADAPPRTDGNVVVSGQHTNVYVILDPKKRREHFISKRFPLPPGRHRLMLTDRQTHECPSLVVDAPKEGELAYVYITADEVDTLNRCRTLGYKRLKLRVDP